MKNKDKKLIVIVAIIWMLLFVVLGVYQSYENKEMKRLEIEKLKLEIELKKN